MREQINTKHGVFSGTSIHDGVDEAIEEICLARIYREFGHLEKELGEYSHYQSEEGFSKMCKSSCTHIQLMLLTNKQIQRMYDLVQALLYGAITEKKNCQAVALIRGFKLKNKSSREILRELLGR